MPITTNILGGGITFNEWHPVSFATDYNGDPEPDATPGRGASDGYVEFINVSTTDTIDIGGYEYWVFDGATMVLAHTVPAGTFIAPGETYTIVSGQTGGGGTPTGISGQVAVADVAFSQTESVSMLLADPSGNFIALTESGGQTFFADDVDAAGLDLANLQGQDIIDSPLNNQSVGRFPDGDDVWQTNQGPTPGDPNCFLVGTRIQTPSGPVPIEHLAAGDEIVTASGAIAPILWLARQTVRTKSDLPERLMPVRIRAGALGEGLPAADLTVTADHGIVIDGLLVNAGALINGSSIAPVPLAEFGSSYTVYHIELETHDVILAEGVPTESLIDYTGRASFDNYAEYRALHGADRPIREMALPRISAQRQLPVALRERLGISSGFETHRVPAAA